MKPKANEKKKVIIRRKLSNTIHPYNYRELKTNGNIICPDLGQNRLNIILFLNLGRWRLNMQYKRCSQKETLRVNHIKRHCTNIFQYLSAKEGGNCYRHWVHTHLLMYWTTRLILTSISQDYIYFNLNHKCRDTHNYKLNVQITRAEGKDGLNIGGLA